MGQSGNIVAGIAALGGGIAQAQASRTQGKIARSQAELNAQIAESQASDAIKRGEKEASAHKMKVKQMMGSQRAALAAQGLDLSGESAMAGVGDTAYFGEMDIQQIKMNAYREAFGYKQQASNLKSQGRLDYLAGRAGATSSFLTGGMQALSYGAMARDSYIKDKKKG